MNSKLYFFHLLIRTQYELTYLTTLRFISTTIWKVLDPKKIKNCTILKQFYRVVLYLTKCLKISWSYCISRLANCLKRLRYLIVLNTGKNRYKSLKELKKSMRLVLCNLSVYLNNISCFYWKYSCFYLRVKLLSLALFN